MVTPERLGALTPLQMAWLQELGLDRRILQVAFDIAEPGGNLSSKPQQLPNKALVARHEPALFKASGSLPKREKVPAVATPAILPADLDSLKAEAAHCTRCGLHSGRHQAVFGDGQIETPDWMVIGEAPGEQDDQVGRPFQGPAGHLMQRVFEASGLIPKAKFYYANVVKCRPRGGRVPRKEEIEACLPFLHAQIDQIRPRAILVLGWLAAQALLQEKGNIEQLRERVHTYSASYGQIPVVVTYHPAALLLRGRHKAQVWRDMQLARKLTEAQAQT
jgi:DNA polymerase